MIPSTEPLRLQIEHLLEVGRADQARPLIGRWLASDPHEPEALYLAARIEYATNHPIETRARVADVLAVQPDHREARHLLFKLELDAGRFQAAEEVILALLRTAPEDAFFLAEYARLMLRVVQLPKARQLVDEALRLEPQLPMAQVMDALLHVAEGDDHAASQRLATLMADDPQATHVAMTALVVLDSRRRWREVLEIGRALLRTRPHDQALIETLIEARLRTHWSTKPLWPLLRFGFAGNVAIWGGGVAAIAVTAAAGATSAAGICLLVYIGYRVYSWIWPPILRRWLRRTGF